MMNSIPERWLLSFWCRARASSSAAASWTSFPACVHLCPSQMLVKVRKYSFFPYSCLQLRVLVCYCRAGVVPGTVARVLPAAARSGICYGQTSEITTFSIFRFQALSKVWIFPRKYWQFENPRISHISPICIKTNENQSLSMLHILINFKNAMKTTWFLTIWDIDLGWTHRICLKS